MSPWRVKFLSAVILLAALAVGPIFGADQAGSLERQRESAAALMRWQKWAKAEKECRALIATEERLLGAEHPDIWASRRELAWALTHQGKHAEAVNEHRVLIAAKERVFGAEHLETATSRWWLADALHHQGKDAQAEKEYRTLIAIQERVLVTEFAMGLLHLGILIATEDRVPGAALSDIYLSRGCLAEVLTAQAKHAEAEMEYRKLLAMTERRYGPDSVRVAYDCKMLALCLEARGKLEEALEFVLREERVGGPSIQAKAIRQRIDAKLKQKLAEKRGR